MSELLKLPPNHAYPSSLVLYCVHRRDSPQLRITKLLPVCRSWPVMLHFGSVISILYEQDGRYFIAMEVLQGKPLHDLISEGQRAVDEVKTLAALLPGLSSRDQEAVGHALSEVGEL